MEQPKEDALVQMAQETSHDVQTIPVPVYIPSGHGGLWHAPL